MGNCCSGESPAPAPASAPKLAPAPLPENWQANTVAERKLRWVLKIDDKIVCHGKNAFDAVGDWDITPPGTSNSENTYEKRLTHLTKLAFGIQDCKTAKPEDYTIEDGESSYDVADHKRIEFAVYLKRWRFRYIDLLALQVDVCLAHLPDQVELIIDACKSMNTGSVAAPDPESVFLKLIIANDKSPMQSCANKEQWRKDRLKIAGYFLEVGTYHRKFKNMLVNAIEKYQDIDLARLLLRHKAVGRFDAIRSAMWYGLRDPKSPPLLPSDAMPSEMKRRLEEKKIENYHYRTTYNRSRTTSAIGIVAGDGSTIHVNVNNGNGNSNTIDGSDCKSGFDEQAWQAKSRPVQRLMTMLIYNSYFHPNEKLWEDKPYSEWTAYLDHWLMLRMKPAAALINFNLLCSSSCRGCNFKLSSEEKKESTTIQTSQTSSSSRDWLQHLGCDPLLLMPDLEDEDLPLAKKFIAMLESDLTRQYNPQSPNYPLYSAWLARTTKVQNAAQVAKDAQVLEIIPASFVNCS